MSHGYWSLQYMHRDRFSVTIGHWEYDEIPLQAKNEKDALNEAKIKWSKKVHEAEVDFEEFKISRSFPPDGLSKFTSIYGPTRPCLSYKIELHF